MRMLSRTTMLAAAAAIFSIAQSCDISGNVAGVLDVQCRICQFATEAECLGGGNNATIHDSCSWTPGHGCRPSGILVPFVNLLNQEEYYQTAHHLVQYQENCTSFMTADSCAAGGCDWNDEIEPDDAHNVLGQAQCVVNEVMRLSLLLSFVFELSYDQTLMWTARNERCQGLTPDGPDGGCAAGVLTWAGSSTPETDAIFPCKEDDGKCTADAENTIRGMSFNAAPAGSALKAAFKAQVLCETVYGGASNKPGYSDDEGSWSWTPTAGNPSGQTVLSGWFGNRNDCARAVNSQCPTHNYAHFLADSTGDMDNNTCACQTIDDVVPAQSSGEAMYLGISVCQTAGVNCTQMCVDNPFCRYEGNECDFDNDAVQSFPAGFSDTFLGPTEDPILRWQVAYDHCAATDCKDACDATLGGECDWDDEVTDSQWVQWNNNSVAQHIVSEGDRWSRDDCVRWATDDHDCAANGFPIVFYQDADPACSGHCPPYCACGQNVDGSQTPVSTQAGAAGWAAWLPTAGACKLSNIVWPMDEMSAGRTAWVKPFVRSLFGECEDLEDRAACIALRGDHGSRTCRWQPTVAGAGNGGSCSARMEAAFIPALPNNGHCAGALSDIAETFEGCLANPDETSCNAGTHFMHANATHDSVHVCEWSCGQCVPGTAFVETLDTAQYPVAAAFMPNDGECTCTAGAAVCPTRNPTAAAVPTAPPVVGVTPTAPPVAGQPTAVPMTYTVSVTFNVDFNTMDDASKETMRTNAKTAFCSRITATGVTCVVADLTVTLSAGTRRARTRQTGTTVATVTLPAGTTSAQATAITNDIINNPVTITSDTGATTTSTGATVSEAVAGDVDDSAASIGAQVQAFPVLMAVVTLGAAMVL
jgi:hypothetical protein